MVIYTCEMEIPIRLDSENMRSASQTLNVYYSGKRDIPLNEKIPEKLLEASYRLHMTHLVKMKVSIHEDGRLEIGLKNGSS